jgi:hypothetical protein
VSDQGKDLEKFLKSTPWMRKWIHECVSCHHRGHKPELPASRYDHTGVSITKLRRLADEMFLDGGGVCEECRCATGKAEGSSHIVNSSSSSTSVCEERERLDAAYRDAMRAKDEFESRLTSDIASGDANIKRRAKNELKRVEKHYYRFMDELMAHEKKHGCGS